MLRVYYRISDNGYPKPKLPEISKEDCLQNFLDIFSNEVDFWFFFCDNCEFETVEMVKKITSNIKKKKIFETIYGNAGSLKFALETAIHDRTPPNTLVYFVEDDYLHQYKSPQLIKQGLEIADYITLYDHPDKYMPGYYNGGEWSKVVKTKDSHWRYTVSTCMTFATTIRTMKKDLPYWKPFINGDHPHDHKVFTEGLVNRNFMEDTKLAVCIPGRAFHIDLTVQIEMGCWIEEWALDYACKRVESKIQPLTIEEMKLLENSKGLDRLKILAALKFNKKSHHK